PPAQSRPKTSSSRLRQQAALPSGSFSRRILLPHFGALASKHQQDTPPLFQPAGTQLSVIPLPALPSGVTYVQVSGGGDISAALRSDGSVVAWTTDSLSLGGGVVNVPALPTGLTYVKVSAGSIHAVARRSDDSVVAWGNNFYGQCNVPGL